MWHVAVINSGRWRHKHTLNRYVNPAGTFQKASSGLYAQVFHPLVGNDEVSFCFRNGAIAFTTVLAGVIGVFFFNIFLRRIMQKKQKTLCQRRNSYRYRNNPIFLRNGYACAGEYQFPIVRRQEFKSIPKSFVYITDAKAGREQASWNKGVHCFVDDNKIDDLFNRPQKYRKLLSSFSVLLSPDYSLYREMPEWIQIQAVGRSRWVGAHWQTAWGCQVIPTVSWAGPESFKFCFDGIEEGCWVAVSTVGNRKSPLDRKPFMHGFDAMIERIKPSGVLCYGKPFEGMDARSHLVVVDYVYPRTRPPKHFKCTQLLLFPSMLPCNDNLAFSGDACVNGLGTSLCADNASIVKRESAGLSAVSLVSDDSGEEQ